MRSTRTRVGAMVMVPVLVATAMAATSGAVVGAGAVPPTVTASEPTWEWTAGTFDKSLRKRLTYLADIASLPDERMVVVGGMSKPRPMGLAAESLDGGQTFSDIPVPGNEVSIINDVSERNGTLAAVGALLKQGEWTAALWAMPRPDEGWRFPIQFEDAYFSQVAETPAGRTIVGDWIYQYVRRAAVFLQAVDGTWSQNLIAGEADSVYRAGPDGNLERHWFTEGGDVERGERVAVSPDGIHVVLTTRLASKRNTFSRLWQSPDTENWEKAGPPRVGKKGRVEVVDVVWGPSGFLLATNERSKKGTRSFIWHSSGGREWQAVAETGLLTALTAGADGAVAFARSQATAGSGAKSVFVLTSPDGLTWQGAYEPGLAKARITSAAVLGDGTVVALGALPGKKGIGSRLRVWVRRPIGTVGPIVERPAPVASASPTPVEVDTPLPEPGTPPPTAGAPRAVNGTPLDLTWTMAEPNPRYWLPGVFVSGVEALPGGGFLAVGGMPAPDRNALAWTSEDGLDWLGAFVPDGEGAVMSDVTAVGDGLVATGHEASKGGRTGLVWTYLAEVDGLGKPQQIEDAVPRQVLTTSDGPVLLGDRIMAGERVAAEFSTTPSTVAEGGIQAEAAWVSQPIAGAASPERARRMAESADGIRVVLTWSPGGEGTVRTGLWRSGDGQTWEQTEVPGPEASVTSEPIDIAWLPSGFVLAANDLVAAGSAGRLWHSPDGLDWQPVVTTNTLHAMEASESGVFAFSGPSFDPGLGSPTPTMLWSEDGLSWAETEVPEFEDARIGTATVAPDGRIVAIGTVGGADKAEPETHIWLGVPVPS